MFNAISGFYDAAKREGRAQGIAEGRDIATVGFIQARMNRRDSLEEALDVLCIPQDQHEKYKRLVQDAQNQQSS